MRRLAVLLLCSSVSIWACSNSDDDGGGGDTDTGMEDIGMGDTMDDTMDDPADDTAEDTVDDTAEDTVEDTAEDTVEDTTEDTVEDTTEDTTTDTVEDTTADTVDDTTDADMDTMTDTTMDADDTSMDTDMDAMDTDMDTGPVEPMAATGGETCATATALDAGFWTIELGDYAADETGYGGNCRVGFTPIDDPGPDASFTVTVPARTAIRAELDDVPMDVQARLLLLSGCGDISMTCESHSDSFVSWFNHGDMPVDLVLQIDTGMAGDAGAVDFYVWLTPEGELATGDLCETATTLTGTSATITGDTTELTSAYNIFEGNPVFCSTDALGPDEVYMIEVPAMNEVVLTPSTSFDGLRIGTSEVCPALAENCLDLTSSLPLTRRNRSDAAVTYYVFVDGRYANSAGPYVIDVQVRPIP